MSTTAMKQQIQSNQATAANQSQKFQRNQKQNIQANEFFQILLSGDVSAEERQKQFATRMVATLDKERDRETIKEYEAFREWLTDQTTTLAEQIISLTNTQTFAEMQQTIKDMNNDLLDFEDRIHPLMDIVDSIYQLRNNGVIIDAFREIKNDRVREEELNDKLTKLNIQIEHVGQFIRKNEIDIVELSNKRGFFGFGNITEDSRIAIDLKQKKIDEDKKLIERLGEEVVYVREELSEKKSKLGDMAVHKEKLRELLDITSEEHTSRVIGLRDSASKFIETSRERTGSLRNQFGGLINQIEISEDNNSSMSKIYAIMVQGLSDSEKLNLEKRETITVAAPDESIIAQNEREEKIRNLDSFTKNLKSSHSDTINNYGDIVQQSIRINTMKDSTQQQLDVTRQLNTGGVAATANRLATVLTAVSGAALGESAAVAKATQDAMRISTNKIAEREVMRVAMGVDISDDMEKVLNELASISEVQTQATQIAREGILSVNEKLEEIRIQAEIAKRALSENISVASDTPLGGGGNKQSNDSSKGKAPFKF